MSIARLLQSARLSRAALLGVVLVGLVVPLGCNGDCPKPTIKDCGAFLAPPGTTPLPTAVVTKGTDGGGSQLDKGGFVLWQVQGGTWQEVGWVFRAMGDVTEHWVYKATFAHPSCALPPDAGCSWTLAFQCTNPTIQTLPQFLNMVRQMNGGNTDGLDYRMHVVQPGTWN